MAQPRRVQPATPVAEGEVETEEETRVEEMEPVEERVEDALPEAEEEEEARFRQTLSALGPPQVSQTAPEQVMVQASDPSAAAFSSVSPQ